MELRSSFTVEVYSIFQDLHITINLYTSKEYNIITTKQSKKKKKRELRKIWIQYDKGGLFKAKKFGKRETTISKDDCCFIIIAT